MKARIAKRASQIAGRAPDAADRTLIEDLRASFAAHADGTDAPQMQRYMKSAMPFYGIKAPLRRLLQAEVFAAHPLSTTAALAATMQKLWREARFREERYAALELPRTRSNRRLATLDLLPTWREFIVDGAWWDFCDDISAAALGPLLLAHPARLKPELLRWARGRDLWLRRAAILCQRKLKTRTDIELLYACIEPSLTSDEFFLRKGIGWALRERAYVAPAEVIDFCRRCRNGLSALTRREALRVLAARGNTRARALM